MKKYGWILILGLLLGACSGQETFETISDVAVVSVEPQQKRITAELPGELALPVMEKGSDRLYLSDDYEIAVQTMEGGDLERTLRAVSGHGSDEMTMMETSSHGMDRVEFVWAAAGEKGDRVGRGLILDDGSYHYCMTALWEADSPVTTQINWDQVFSSFSVESY